MTIFYHPAIRGLLSLWLLFLCLALVWAIMSLLQQKNGKLLLPVLLLFAGCDVYWQYLKASSFFVGNNLPYYRFDNAPVWLIALINTALTLMVVSLCAYVLHLQKRHVSAISIKESFDTLPSGVCVYETGGRIYLMNAAMERIILLLGGKPLYNGERLWQLLRQNSTLSGEENKAVVTRGKSTYSFTRYLNDVNGQALFEIIAADITEEAAQNRQLESKNRELEQLNAALEDYNHNLAATVRERELLQSKARIHDEMNVLMISTIKSMEEYRAEDVAGLIERWNSNLLAIEKDTEPYRKNPLETLEDLARSLGIQLVFSGEFPRKIEQARLLTAAVSESMTNALRHAGAATLFVRSDQAGAVITNDGVPPKEPITEGGGLGNLRKRAQQLHATVEIESEPAFRMKINYQKERSE